MQYIKLDPNKESKIIFPKQILDIQRCPLTDILTEIYGEPKKTVTYYIPLIYKEAQPPSYLITKSKAICEKFKSLYKAGGSIIEIVNKK